MRQRLNLRAASCVPRYPRRLRLWMPISSRASRALRSLRINVQRIERFAAQRLQVPEGVGNMRILVIAVLCFAGSVLSGFALYAGVAPSYGEVIYRCVEEQRELHPAARAQACQCFAETVSTVLWTVRRTVARSVVDADAALANTCRAQAFRLDPQTARDPS